MTDNERKLIHSVELLLWVIGRVSSLDKNPYGAVDYVNKVIHKIRLEEDNKQSLETLRKTGNKNETL